MKTKSTATHKNKCAALLMCCKLSFSLGTSEIYSYILKANNSGLKAGRTAKIFYTELVLSLLKIVQTIGRLVGYHQNKLQNKYVFKYKIRSKPDGHKMNKLCFNLLKTTLNIFIFCLERDIKRSSLTSTSISAEFIQVYE